MSSRASSTPAFGAVYDEHFGFVWAVLRRLGVSDGDIEDVVQEVFIVVHRRLHAFEARASVRTWLYAIAVRVFWNHSRRRRNQPTVAETSASTLPAFDGDPERFAAQREAGGLLQDLLGKLDPVKRTVFVLSELEGLTAPQIAEITGANERTVYSRLRAARSTFEAGLARARARERNDAMMGAHVRELARRVDDRPPAEAQQRTWAAVMLQLAAEPAVPLVATGLGATLKIVGLSLGVGLGALGIVYAVSVAAATEPTDRGASSGRGAPVERVARPDASAEEPAAPPGAAAALPPAEEVAATSPVAADAAASPSAVGSSAEASLRSTTPEAHAAASPRSTTPADPAPRAAPPKPRAEVEPAADDPITAELALMQQARAALRSGDAARTLRLLDDHAKRFPTGNLARERDRTRITALCRVGRTAEADRLARALSRPTPACGSEPH